MAAVIETTARRGISEMDVWTAADAVLAEGRRPTIDAVRQRLGRGSPNTVMAHLDSWFASLASRLGDRGEGSIAPAPPPVMAIAGQLWEAALFQARQIAESDLDAERARLGLRQEELEARALRVERAAETQQARVEAALAAGKAAEEARDAAAKRESQALERVRRAEDELTRLARAMDQATSERRDLEATWARERSESQAQLAAAQTRLEGQERHWHAEVERARAEAESRARELAEARSLHAAERGKLATRAEAAEARLRDAETATRAALEQAAQFRGEAGSLRERLDAQTARGGRRGPRKWGKRSVPR